MKAYEAERVSYAKPSEKKTTVNEVKLNVSKQRRTKKERTVNGTETARKTSKLFPLLS